MGFDLNAFLGRTSDLRTWAAQLPGAVVCELSGELGLVPVTARLFQELRSRLPEKEADRLDAVSGYSTWPSPSCEEAARRWGAEASRGTVVAYVSVGEFGDFGYDHATLWSDGREVLSRADVPAVLNHFRERAGFALGSGPIDLEQYRGENAAEKWAAAAGGSGRGKI